MTIGFGLNLEKQSEDDEGIATLLPVYVKAIHLWLANLEFRLI